MLNIILIFLQLYLDRDLYSYYRIIDTNLGQNNITPIVVIL